MDAQVLVLRGVRQLGWETRLLPPPGPGDVLVSTLLSAVSVASELSLVEGRVATPFPRPLGYQTLGLVEAAGAGAGLLPGQRVVTMSGHVSAAVLNAERCLAVPDHIPDRMALAAVLGEETCKGIRLVAPAADDRVLVAGAGLLGLLTVFNLTRRGVREVTVLEPDPERRELARAFGAHTVAPGEEIRRDFDVGFECSASPEGFGELLSRLRPRGRACVISDGNWGRLTLPPAFHERELQLVASSDGEDYHGYAGWLWAHPEPLLVKLFEVTVELSGLIGMFARLRRFPRPVSVVADWSARLHG